MTIRTPLTVTLAAVAGLALGGTSYAAPDLAAKTLSKAKVSAIARAQASKVLDERSASLHVARAGSAETARTAQTAENAASLGGRPATAYLTADDLVARSDAGECDPWSSTFHACSTVQLTVDRPSRLLVVSELMTSDDSLDGTFGRCRLVLDGTVLPETTIRAGFVYASQFLGGEDDNVGIGMTTVTAPVAPGQHTVGSECNELAEDIDYNDTTLSVLAIPAG